MKTGDETIASSRMSIQSAVAATATHITAELAGPRNDFVAALADEVYIAHATVGGHVETLTRRLRSWGIPLTSKSTTSTNL